MISSAGLARCFPVDVRLSSHYDRDHLNQTLGRPLKRSTVDTVSSCLSVSTTENHSVSVIQTELVRELREQIDELRSIVNQAVRTWNPLPEQERDQTVALDDIRTLEGVWVNKESRTYFHARVIGDELIAPYCFGGNHCLTSAYYGWKKMGEFWFARFCWLTRDISGFTFLKPEAAEKLVGAWWTDDESEEIPERPNMASGVSVRWERISQPRSPDWALQFFEEVRREGVVNCLSAKRKRPQPESSSAGDR
jgi:hypothetical protein